MNNHQKEAGITEFVGPLLKDLKVAKERVPENSGIEKFIDQISTEVVEIKDFLNSREKSDRELVGYFGKIQRQIDPWMDHEPRAKSSDLSKKDTIIDVGSNTSYQMDEEVSKVQEFKDLLESLDSFDSYCVKSLSMFPENTELKKRLVIYWWRWRWRWSALDLERLFSILIDKKVLIPVHREHNKAIDCFTIEPTFYKWLISNSERYGRIESEKREEGIWHLLYGERCKMLLNLDQRYLNSKDIMDNSSKHDLEVVQLGNWRYTETKVHNKVEETGSKETKSKDHIEVDQTDFLKKLGKDVRYLSLQGISGITELPESVGKLADLGVLDLRACHNLEKLPQKPRSTLIQKLIRWKFSKESGWFNWLEILDISECYLLDHMPKWVCELYFLEVLKGFVVGSLGNKNQSCRLRDLSKLDYLIKLSIRFTKTFWVPKFSGALILSIAF